MSAVSEDDGFIDISPSGGPLFAVAGPRVVFQERIGVARRFAPAPALGRRPLDHNGGGRRAEEQAMTSMLEHPIRLSIAPVATDGRPLGRGVEDASEEQPPSTVRANRREGS